MLRKIIRARASDLAEQSSRGGSPDGSVQQDIHLLGLFGPSVL